MHLIFLWIFFSNWKQRKMLQAPMSIVTQYFSHSRSNRNFLVTVHCNSTKIVVNWKDTRILQIRCYTILNFFFFKYFFWRVFCNSSERFLYQTCLHNGTNCYHFSRKCADVILNYLINSIWMVGNFQIIFIWCAGTIRVCFREAVVSVF